MQWSYLDLWRVTQHKRFPTRFTYLKGSSMELLTLEPTSKIDFGLQHSTLEKWLQRRYHVSELKWNSHWILAALSAQGPLFIGWGSEWASGKFCHISEFHTLLRKSSHTHALHEFSNLFKISICREIYAYWILNSHLYFCIFLQCYLTVLSVDYTCVFWS
jgi:hypothetical protein